MKLVFIAILLGLAAAVTFFLFYTRESIKLPIASIIDAFFLVAPLRSEVFLKEKNIENFEILNKETSAPEGSTLRTSATGRASILYPTSNITNLGPYTELVLLEIKENPSTSRLSLVAGSIWSKIENIAGESVHYEIETENMLASVRGTIFAIKFLKGVSSLFVVKGLVLAEAVDPLTRAPLPGGKAEVKTGEKIIVDNLHLPTLQKPLRAEKLTATDLEEPIIKENFEVVRNKTSINEAPLNLRIRTLDSSKKSATQADSAQPEKQTLIEEKIQPIYQEPSAAEPQPVPQEKFRIISLSPTTLEFESFTGPAPDSASAYEKNLRTTAEPSPPQSREKYEIIIKGNEFWGVHEVQIGETNTDFFIQDNETIFAFVWPTFPPGTYSISLAKYETGIVSLPNALRISYRSQ